MRGALPALVQQGEGTPLVMLHGFGGVKEQWGPLLRRLPGRTLAALDLPGHGAATHWPDRARPAAARDAVLATMDAFGWDRVHLVGHSRGGVIASLVALKAPRRLAAMTLLAPGGFSRRLNRSGLGAMASAATPDAMREALAAIHAPSAPPAMFPVRSKDQREALAEILATMAESDPQPTLDMDRVAATNVPLTLLWGTSDTVLPIEGLIELAPSMRLVRLEGAGHMMIEEAAQTIADHLG